MIVAVLVSAAVSLKAPLQTAAVAFEKANPGEAITFNLGASGQLATQIEQGAPADLFIAASTEDVERLAKAKRIDPASLTVVIGNRLLLVVAKGGTLPADVAGLADPRFARIAIGNPKSVPAGRYAKEALTRSGVWDAIEKRLIFGENVRQVDELVSRGDADAGLVYATDLAASGIDAASSLEVPEKLYEPIVYEGAVVAGAKSADRARAFLAFLASPQGRHAFLAAGFSAPRAPAAQ